MADTKSTFEYIDFYCERGQDLSVLAEPLNLFTNLFFVIASVLAISFLVKNNNLKLANFDIVILSVILGIIGLGSGAYHYKPNVATLNFDVIPIAIFIHVYVISFFIRVLKFKWYLAGLCLVAFIGAGVLSEIYLDRDMLNGTIMYIPTYLTLIIMAGLCKKLNPEKFKPLLVVLGFWSLSLLFRTIDKSFCTQSFEIGTHFLWHTFNAIVLYKLVLILQKNK